MALIFLRRFWGATCTRNLIGQSARFVQTLRVEPALIKYVTQHRQLSGTSSEAGGQLFGIVNDREIRLVRATGPYRGDDRGRYHYRSDQLAAQRAIARQAKAGLLYLGEWHTHAEDHPKASMSDKDAMKKLLRNSKLNANSLLLLIVGRSSKLDGLNICSYGTSDIDHWMWSEGD